MRLQGLSRSALFAAVIGAAALTAVPAGAFVVTPSASLVRPSSSAVDADSLHAPALLHQVQANRFIPVVVRNRVCTRIAEISNRVGVPIPLPGFCVSPS
jgi:hypothetical protein